MDRRNNRRGNNNRNSVPKAVERFGEMSFKSFYKKNKHYYDKKKEARYDFYFQLLDDLPEVIDFFCQKGHVQQPWVQEPKTLCYGQFLNKEDKDRFVEFLTKVVKEEGKDAFENMIFLPIMLREMIQGIIEYNTTREEGTPEMDPPDKLFALSEAILKKRLKKFAKAGMDQSMAFDLLSVMPDTKAIKYSPYFRVREVFDILYRYAETLNIDFGKVISFLFDSNDYNFIIGFALQEKKDKQKGFNEKQKGLWMQITKWTFEELEDMDERDIRDILKNYITLRKKDSLESKDGNRRFYISSLPEDDYPTIVKIVKQIKNQDPDAEKYL